MKTIAFTEFLIVFANSCFVGTSALLTQRPAGDVFGLLSKTVELNCATDLNRSINWEFASYGTTSYSWIYLNSQMTESEKTKYKIESGDGNYRLIMKTLDWSFAGMYRCTDDAGLGESAITQLTVIDPRPSCFHDPSLEPSPRSSCFPGVMFCAFYYLGDAVPTLNLSKYIQERKTTADTSTMQPPKKVKIFNATFDQPCEKTNQRVEITNSSTNEACYTCVFLMHFATDEKSLFTEEDVRTTVYKITLNHSKNIGLLSFTSPISTKIFFHDDQNDRDVTSRASCMVNDTTIGLSVLVSVAVLGLVVLNLKRGSDGATPPPGTYSNVTDNGRYEVVEGDFSDPFSSATAAEATYDALGQRGPYKPCIYARLKGARQSTQVTRHQATREEEEVPMSTGASWDPDSSEEPGRRKSNVEQNYITLVQ